MPRFTGLQQHQRKLDSRRNNFGPRLRALIEQSDVSFEDFWRTLGISRATLFNWLKRDDPPPSTIHREKLVSFFDQPADYILFGAVQKSKTDVIRMAHKQRVPINPSYPTRPEIDAFIKSYLDVAEKVPGGLAHAYIELTSALQIEKLKRSLENQPPSNFKPDM